MQCKVCGQQSGEVFRAQVLKKYDVAYYRCPGCGFMQTEEPYWLDESYSSAISDLDLGPVNRAITGAQIVESIILAGFDPDGRFIDWGGGYGVFTRLMRDKGYDFFWQDRYCQNLFAKHFVADDDTYELMTSFEVFEHLVQPMADIEKMLARSTNVLFTTQLPPARLTSAAEWWYLSPEHGQHVSIYSVESLQVIARTFDLHRSTDGAALHLLSREPFPPTMFKVIARNGKAANVMRRVRRKMHRKHSLLMDDFRTVTGIDA
jgi:hypothetical protein